MKNVKAGHTKPIVMLDAGHYGKYNRCPAIPAYYESEMNWKLHLLLKAELEQYGIEVRQTRSNQAKDMEVSARGRLSKDCDLLLSIHSNAVGSSMNESVDYPVVYVQIDGKGDTLGNTFAQTVQKTMQTTQTARIGKRVGNNGDYYGILRGAAAVGTMAMIIEHSFHTNTRSTKWLMEESNLQKMAEAHAAVVAEHFGVSKKTETLAGIYKVNSSDGCLNLRNAAGVKNILIETMQNGELVGCFGEAEGDWIKVVSQKSNIGWCHKAYLQKL